jgi:hypothetical protein
MCQFGTPEQAKFRSQDSGVRIQEPGARSQEEPGARSQEPGATWEAQAKLRVLLNPES